MLQKIKSDRIYATFYANLCDISPGYTKRFVAAMCRRNMLLQLVARPVHGSDMSSRRVAATCRLVCTDLKWLGTERDMDEP